MGYKIHNRYEEENNHQTPTGAFFEGLFVGTLGFMTTIAGWLVSLFCWLGLAAGFSWAAAGVLSVGVGISLGVSFARGRLAKIRKKESYGNT